MSILIKNVQVVDGTGAEPYKADVFVQKNLISAIGDLKKKEADETIDGLGNYLTPGFIDVDSASDQYLSIFTYPEQTGFREQGVTTIVGGHCGSSLAPLLYGTLESIRKWADITKINVDWHTTAELFAALEKLKLGVNFGTLTGHSTIRRSIVGETTRGLTFNEINVFKKILTKALEEGAFGMSTGLGYIHGKNTPVDEIKELAYIVKRYDGVYSTHLRNEGYGLLAAIDETLAVAKETGVKTIISHLRPLNGFELQFDEAVYRIKESAEGNVYFYIYPSDTSLVVLYKFLPEWAQERNLERMLEILRNPNNAERLEADLQEIALGNLVVADAPKNEYLVGKSLADLSEMFAIPPIKSLLKLMDITGLKATMLHKNININKITEVIAEDYVMIASNSASRASSDKFIPAERATNTFPKYLQLTVPTKKLSIQAAIRKITSLPANYFGIKDRGILREGKVADLTLIDKNDLSIKETILAGKASSGEPLKRG
ncbi:MAG: amidohydrolase family protein [Candidatus Colwellbacteria bacterium]|nr:amidohydrolase family protein [Candidatus Colwellbacteria bacterium]